MNRKNFLSTVSLGMGGVLLTSNQLLSQTTKPPPLNGELVKAFVGAGHNDLEKVKQMLKENPNLLYSMMDWGGGDFETALEGAGHVGDKEIANYLISMGARPNIFVLTMLGKTKIVTSLLEEFPALLNAKGPHGYTLLHHAERGGTEAADLYSYLKVKGMTETRISLFQ